MSSVRHVVVPTASQPASPDAPSLPAVGGGMTRRGGVRRVPNTGAGAALAAAGEPGLAAQDATPVSAEEASTIEPVSGQALYRLPRDHRWHGGPFYVSPIVPDQKILIPGLSAPLWEGALEVRWESSDGPLLGACIWRNTSESTTRNCRSVGRWRLNCRCPACRQCNLGSGG